MQIFNREYKLYIWLIKTEQIKIIQWFTPTINNIKILSFKFQNKLKKNSTFRAHAIIKIWRCKGKWIGKVATKFLAHIFLRETHIWLYHFVP